MLRLEGVGSAYGGSQVLWSVDMALGAGEAVALLGRNGVGKTTLLRTIIGLQPLTEGRLLYEGNDISKAPTYQRARQGIAYVPQGRDIFAHLTVIENLEIAAAACNGRLARGKKRIPDAIFELFPVLEKLADRKGGNLSGGEQQQLAIARALVSRPKVLLLDEPTEGIQPSVVMHIEDALKRVRHELGIAVLVVEQYLDFAWSFADRYYVLQKGRVVAEGQTAQEAQGAVGIWLNI